MSVLHLNVGRLNVTCKLNRADCTRTKNANRVISCIVITVFWCFRIEGRAILELRRSARGEFVIVLGLGFYPRKEGEVKKVPGIIEGWRR